MVAGEASGDLYGAHLARTLREMAPEVSFYGIGGVKMEEAGVEILYGCEELAVVGITEALSKGLQVWKAYRALRRSLSERRPSVAVLIDYPGFNLPLAKALKGAGIPVLYYVSPQVWAWRPGRARKMAERVDRLAVILPFEVEFYRSYGVKAHFVGHPLCDLLEGSPAGPVARAHLGYSEEETVIAILPGSRSTEVRRLLGPMLEAARILRHSVPQSRFPLALAPTLREDDLPRREPWLEVFEGRTWEVMAASDVMMVASGTATLEGALLGVPMVILYKVNPISYLLGRMMVNVRHIGLPNLLAGREVVPELIQGAATPWRIAEEVAALLGKRRRQEVKAALEEIKGTLKGGASRRVAEMALELMGVN